jgi:hypothetical protein
MWWQLPTVMVGVFTVGFAIKGFTEWLWEVRELMRIKRMSAYLDGRRKRP